MKKFIYTVGILFIAVTACDWMDSASQFNGIVALILRIPAIVLMVNGIIKLTEDK